MPVIAAAAVCADYAHREVQRHVAAFPATSDEDRAMIYRRAYAWRRNGSMVD